MRAAGGASRSPRLAGWLPSGRSSVSAGRRQRLADTRSDRPHPLAHRRGGSARALLPTASGDSDGSVRASTSSSPVSVASRICFLPRPPADARARLLAQDAVYVGGGNTANMLAIWRVHGFDVVLREAWERGVLLFGGSAGMVCWFEAAVTDSYGPELAGITEGLGFLPGSACPHYDGEERRRPRYRELVAAGFPAGIAADDGVGVHFVERELREVVSCRSGAGAYRVSAGGEEAIAARLLERLRRPFSLAGEQRHSSTSRRRPSLTCFERSVPSQVSRSGPRRAWRRRSRCRSAARAQRVELGERPAAEARERRRGDAAAAGRGGDDVPELASRASRSIRGATAIPRKRPSRPAIAKPARGPRVHRAGTGRAAAQLGAARGERQAREALDVRVDGERRDRPRCASASGSSRISTGPPVGSFNCSRRRRRLPRLLHRQTLLHRGSSARAPSRRWSCAEAAVG